MHAPWSVCTWYTSVEAQAGLNYEYVYSGMNESDLKE